METLCQPARRPASDRTIHPIQRQLFDCYRKLITERHERKNAPFFFFLYQLVTIHILNGFNAAAQCNWICLIALFVVCFILQSGHRTDVVGGTAARQGDGQQSGGSVWNAAHAPPISRSRQLWRQQLSTNPARYNNTSSFGSCTSGCLHRYVRCRSIKRETQIIIGQVLMDRFIVWSIFGNHPFGTSHYVVRQWWMKAIFCFKALATFHRDDVQMEILSAIDIESSFPLWLLGCPDRDHKIQLI